MSLTKISLILGHCVRFPAFLGLGGLLAPLFLAACAVGPGTYPGETQSMARPESVWAQIPTSSGRPLPAGAPILGVASRMGPMIENTCLQVSRSNRCDFVIAVDDDPSREPNAFQTLDSRGRPVIILTSALLNMTENPDEIAFVLGHEAGHHIAGHIAKRQGQAQGGAILGGILGEISGLKGEDILRTQEIFATIASQQYSKDYELEADALGAEMAWRAGYNPRKGAEFFNKLPDSRGGFLATHPRSAQRRAVVDQTVRQLEAFPVGS